MQMRKKLDKKKPKDRENSISRQVKSPVVHWIVYAQTISIGITKTVNWKKPAFKWKSLNKSKLVAATRKPIGEIWAHENLNESFW
jgi:hypothetical protein